MGEVMVGALMGEAVTEEAVVAVVVVGAEVAEVAADKEAFMNPDFIEGCESYVPNGLLLQWHITDRCNLRCAHCYQETYSGAERPLSELLLVLQQFEDLLREWRRNRPTQGIAGHITVTGGEPFVRSDFLELLHEFALRKAFFSFGILTNGLLITDEIGACLAELKPRFVQLSVEGTRETHDRIRGEGNYDRVVAGLRNLIRENIFTLISFTAHRQNFREFPEVARLGCRLGVGRVWTDRLIPSGTGKAMEEAVMSPTETREYCELIRQAQEEVATSRSDRTEISAHRALQFLLGGGGRPYHCTVGDSLVTIMPNGDVYPCRRMPLRVGNVFETPLREIYGHSPVFQKLRNPLNTAKECQKCCFSQLCRGGLKCLSMAVYGDPFRPDPGCWISEKGKEASQSASSLLTVVP